MRRPGKMLKQLISSIGKKPATRNYPKERHFMPKGFRGKLVFDPSKCIGCKMCMRDCPSEAITITRKADNKFEARVDLGKCIYCAQCVDSCLKKALAATQEFELAQADRAKLKVIIDVPFEEKPGEKT